MKIVDSFDNRLRKALEIRNVKSIDLAKTIGISKQAVSTYVNGVSNPKLPTIKAIAEALNVAPDWLIGYDVTMTYEPDKKNNSSELDEYINSLEDPEVQEAARLLTGLDPERLKIAKEHILFNLEQQKKNKEK